MLLPLNIKILWTAISGKRNAILAAGQIVINVTLTDHDFKKFLGIANNMLSIEDVSISGKDFKALLGRLETTEADAERLFEALVVLYEHGQQGRIEKLDVERASKAILGHKAWRKAAGK